MGIIKEALRAWDSISKKSEPPLTKKEFSYKVSCLESDYKTYTDTTELTLPNQTELDWKNYTDYLSPIIPCLSSFPPEKVSYGNTYIASRKNGSKMTMVPFFVPDNCSRNGRRCKDSLFINAFNEDGEMIGFDAISLRHDSGRIQGGMLLAVARGGEGIGSALEEVRRRTSTELVEIYKAKGIRGPIYYHVEDDNGKTLAALKQKTAENPNHPYLAHRLDHAQNERVRWRSIFPQSEEVIYPSLNAPEYGLNKNQPTAYLLFKSQSPETNRQWSTIPAGNEVLKSAQNQGFYDLEQIHEKMKTSLLKLPR